MENSGKIEAPPFLGEGMEEEHSQLECRHGNRTRRHIRFRYMGDCGCGIGSKFPECLTAFGLIRVLLRIVTVQRAYWHQSHNLCHKAMNGLCTKHVKQGQIDISCFLEPL